MRGKIFMVSLGCPKNLTDAETMAGTLLASGYVITQDEGEADIALINTCSFLSSSCEESCAEIEHFLSLKARGKIRKVVITGCLVEREKEKLLERFPGTDAIVGINALESIGRALEGNLTLIPASEGHLQPPRFKARLTARHSAYLKIADGCDNRCSYCTIPSIRGPFRSKTREAVLEEARILADSGAVELSLIAQDTTSYGTDIYGSPKLYELLSDLLRIDKIKWIRIMYAYPERLTPETLMLMRDSGKICRYLDMPLQHISDPVLKAMNRKSTERSLRKKIDDMRRLMPDIALRTNFIVGFPGETDKDFKRLLRFVTETRFDNVGVFTYSREPGTPAANLKNQIDTKTKLTRQEEIISAQSAVVDDINSKLIGTRTEALMDSASFGRSYRDAPEIDGKIELFPEPGKPVTIRPGEFVKVKITGANGYVRRAVPSKK